MGESVYYRGADSKTSEGAWAGHEFNLGDILPGLVTGIEFVFDEC